MSTLQEVKEFQKRERAKHKVGRMSAPHGFCEQCERALTRIEARDRSHKCTKHPAKELAASGAKAITTFERACNKAEKTDTGDAWDLLYTLRSTFNEIEAQLS